MNLSIPDVRSPGTSPELVTEPKLPAFLPRQRGNLGLAVAAGTRDAAGQATFSISAEHSPFISDLGKLCRESAPGAHADHLTTRAGRFGTA